MGTGQNNYQKFKKIWTAVKKDIWHKTGRKEDTKTLFDTTEQKHSSNRQEDFTCINQQADSLRNVKWFSEERIDAIANGSWMANLRFSPFDKTRRDIMFPLNREDYRQRLFVRVKPYRFPSNAQSPSLKTNKA